MPDLFSRRILTHIADQRYRPGSAIELAHDLGIDDDELDAFHSSVQQLVDDGQVLLASANMLVLPPPGREIIGSFRKNPRGFGFVVPDEAREHGDLFIPPENTEGALTGDRVRVRVLRREQRGKRSPAHSPFIGRIVEIIQRADNRYVGNLEKRGSQYLVRVDGKALHDPVVVRDITAKDAKPGDKVVIELIHYPAENELGEGVITEVLGEKGQPDVETVAVMRAYGLSEVFPADVLDQARSAAQAFDEYAALDPQRNGEREDLTGTFIITIDPPDAKDFDDAISIRMIARAEGQAEGPRGQTGGDDDSDSLGPRPSALGPSYELGVHIAHVAHFVKAGTELDKEAHRRGNSAYLPRKVVPMLPELLSNGVCSLQEAVPRFCLSAFISYDSEGHVLAKRFARTVIRSAKRLTYLEAQALIDDDVREAIKHSRTELAGKSYSRQLIDTLKLMDELAKVIRKRRLDNGMIVLGLPEVELVFDDSGRVVDAEPEDDSFTHKIIEMFMVEANEAAASLFDSLRVPMIRRIHADPPVHDTKELRQFARVAGYNIPDRPTRRELQQLLDAVRGKPAQHAVHMAVLQTLSKAEYSPLLIGHFALASEHYTHFTSPIRRYPDLVVHRGLDAYLDIKAAQERSSRGGGGRHKHQIGDELRERCDDEMAMQVLGRHCSGTERKAEAAERDLRNYLVLELLAGCLGEDFAGTVTGVTGSGIYVQIDRYLVDGFMRTADLSESLGAVGEIWKLNRTTGALVAQRSGRSITIGQQFTVRIARVDPAIRQLDLVIIDDRSRGQPAKADELKSKRRQPKGAREGHQKTMKLKQQNQRRGEKKKRRGR